MHSVLIYALHILTCVSHTAHVTDIGCPSVFHTLVFVKMAQPIVKLSSLPGSPMILVFQGPTFFPEFQWEHPNGR